MRIFVSQPRRPWFALARSITILADDVPIGTVRHGERAPIDLPEGAGLISAKYLFWRSNEVVAASIADGASYSASFARPPERAFLPIGAAIALLIAQVTVLDDRPQSTIILVLLIIVSALGVFGVTGRRYIALRPATDR